MGQAKIVLLSPLNQQAEGRIKEIEVEATTVRDALTKICTTHPKLKVYLFAEDEISQSVAIIHNGESLTTDTCAQKALGASDEICIATAICGG
jgi:sulfur carrier protein ThiS